MLWFARDPTVDVVYIHSGSLLRLVRDVAVEKMELRGRGAPRRRQQHRMRDDKNYVCLRKGSSDPLSPSRC